MTRNREERRSPIKQPPLRQAGQSLREQRERIIENQVDFWAIAMGFVAAIALLEWCRVLTTVSPHPVLATVIAVAVAVVAWWQLRKLRRVLRDMRLGMEGEIVVGQSLEELRADGYVVLHDIPGNGFNVDHVLVGPGGVFAVETKTRTKPPSGHDARVVYDGETIKEDGFAPERDPVKQVRAEAAFVKDLVESATGKRYDVRPVVLYPGWYTTFEGPKDIWVLNHKALPAWLRSERRRLSDEDIRLISEALSTYVRSKAAAESSSS